MRALGERVLREPAGRPLRLPKQMVAWVTITVQQARLLLVHIIPIRPLGC